MSTPKRGLDAKLYVNGTLIGQLTGIEFTGAGEYTPFYPMGSLQPTQILQGKRDFTGRYRRAYVDNNYIDLFVNGTECTGSLNPVSGKSIVGSMVITGMSFANMETEESAAVIEEGNFAMYHVVFS